MRIVITGGAGFLGSHLCDYLLNLGNEVICLDNLLTGSVDNITHLLGHERFHFYKHDVTFVSITENIDSSTAMGRFMRDLLGLLARLEREITGERVATDMRHRASQGKFCGGHVPYGYMSQNALYKRLLKAGRSEQECVGCYPPDARSG